MSARAHLLRELRVPVQRDQMVPDALPVTGADQKSVPPLVHELPDAADVGGDDGLLEVHGLEQRVGDPLVVRAQHEHVGGRHSRVGIGEVADEIGRRGDAQVAGQRFESLPAPAVSDQDEAGLR